MQTYTRYLWGLLGVTIGATAIVFSRSSFIREKLNTFSEFKSPLSSGLTPARDLRGTWKSSLIGKGIEVNGTFTTGPGTTTVHENGDMELIIDSVINNTASGRLRYSDLCVTAQTVMPKPLPSITVPKTCTKDSGYSPITMQIIGSRIIFETANVAGATVTMQGNFTTDIMSGTTTVTLPGYGTLIGEFHLNRK